MIDKFVTFSIIIPLFNKRGVVGGTIQSVLDQQEGDFELIVVNDGSTDDSADIVRSFEDNRIRLFTIKNSGPSAARNYGIQQAVGDWILVLDADDCLLPGALQRFKKALEKWQEAGMITGNFYQSDGRNRILYRETYPDGHVRNPFRAWFNKELMPRAGAFVCRRSIMLEHPFNENLFRLEDVEWLFRIFNDVTIVRINETVMEYRREFSTESIKFPPIEKDYKGHLSFDRSKSLWEKICLYEYYIEAKNFYPADAARLYAHLRRRYGLIMAYHLAFWLRALIRK